MNWDDIKIFHCMAQLGSVGKAASTLNMHHTTILRRLATLEADLGATLFLRNPQGYQLTDLGQRLCELAQRMAQNAEQLQREAQQPDTLSSPLRISVPSNPLVDWSALITEFLAQHPQQALQVQAQSEFSALEQLEAHIALRLTNQPPPHYLGKRVLRIPYRLYGHRNYLAAQETLTRFDQVNWIVWSIPSSLNHRGDTGTTMANWLRAEHPGVRIVLESNNQDLIHTALINGLGVATLPATLGDAMPELREVKELALQSTLELWVLSHRDWRSQPMVQTFVTFARDYLQSHYPEFVR